MNYRNGIFNRYIFLIHLLVFMNLLVLSLPGFPSHKIRREIQKLVQDFQQDSLIRHGQWSMTGLDTKTGEIIIAVNAEKSLAPASCLKLVTTATALCLLGENFQYETRLEYSGQILSQKILNGHLFITGTGDPTLGSSRFDSVKTLPDLLQFWVDSVKAHGITQITGNVIGDATNFDDFSIPENWNWIDMGNYYAAGTSALCINENSFKLIFKPGLKVGDPVEILKTDPEISGLYFVNRLQTGPIGSGDNAYLYAAPDQWNFYLNGTIPAGVPEFSIRGSLPNPAKVAAQLFYQRLQADGIQILGQPGMISEYNVPVNEPRFLISKTISPCLKDIIYWLNKKSINLYAEQLFKTLGRQFLGVASYETGQKAVTEFFKQNNIPLAGFFLEDGSGLSRYNGITTYQLAKVLSVMSQKNCFASYYRSFPIVGDPKDPGTVSHWNAGTAAARNARVKTGSILRVRSHAGYVTDKSGRVISFAIIANDYDGSSRKIDRFHEKLIVLLAQLKR
ncbi:D-alanyl-D-alanine carboxypeptidase/D-alanyl-D-alanine-endopeptidase [candidate division KSB1 bacterium]|nr:D-alanyl-D-alanine carboxypeptidase/D-alanyl-D-alanine-endopeptidase [candidate division KSB1 bacterium]